MQPRCPSAPHSCSRETAVTNGCVQREDVGQIKVEQAVADSAFSTETVACFDVPIAGFTVVSELVDEYVSQGDVLKTEWLSGAWDEDAGSAITDRYSRGVRYAVNAENRVPFATHEDQQQRKSVNIH